MQLAPLAILVFAFILGVLLATQLYRIFKANRPTSGMVVAALCLFVLDAAFIATLAQSWPDMKLWTLGIIATNVALMIAAAFTGVSRADNKED